MPVRPMERTHRLGTKPGHPEAVGLGPEVCHLMQVVGIALGPTTHWDRDSGSVVMDILLPPLLVVHENAVVFLIHEGGGDEEVC